MRTSQAHNYFPIKIGLIIVFSTLYSCSNKTSDKDSNNSDSEQSKTSNEEILSSETPKNGEQSETKIQSPSFGTYCNDRFGFCIQYPENILYPQGESDNGDGQTFRSKSGDVILTVAKVYGSTETEETLSDNFNEYTHFKNSDFPNRTITYKKLSSNFYTVTGFNNGNIFYNKTIIVNGEFASAYIEYPESQKETFNPYCTVINKSFK